MNDKRPMYFLWLYGGGSLFGICLFGIIEIEIIPRILFGLIGLYFLLSAYLFLCPRCKMQIMRPTGMTWENQFDMPRYCLRCGRDRRNVKPFQFICKPEPWDGKYHDEGGGEQPKYRGY